MRPNQERSSEIGLDDPRIADGELWSTAPEVFAAIARLQANLAVDSCAALIDPVRSSISSALRIAIPGTDSASGIGEVNPACVAFAEQFVMDVSGIDDPLRSRLRDQLGDECRTFAQCLYVADYVPRVMNAFGSTFSAEAVAELDVRVRREAVDPASDVGSAITSCSEAIARLRSLDPVLTELVRLREARQHQCRKCQSLRNLSALAAVGDQAYYDMIDEYEQSTLPERSKVALRLVDAMMWHPARLGDELMAQVRTTFDRVEIVELVFDIMRNASAKVAVALDQDQARVTEGVELYDFDEGGTLFFPGRTAQ